jgi:acetolactate synthase-1/2/3 large subunit
LVIAHNGVFGNMRYDQIERYGSRFVGTEPHIPNLTNVAREFGAYSERVENPDDIAPAVRRALASGRPALLEIMMDAAPENLVPPTNPIKLGL